MMGLEDLADQIARGNGVVFVGAGLSQAAGLPSWPGLLWQMLAWSAEHGVELPDRGELEGYINAGDLLLVAEEMRERLGNANFRRFMADVFGRPGLTPTQTHKLLPEIPFSAALTSNYDKLLESAYTVVNQGEAPHVFTHAEYPELSAALGSDEFYVLKIHGTIDRIQTVILGRRDYREVMHANSPYRQHLMTLFSTKTILFLGFGLTDPDLLLLLEELQVIFKEYTRQHYALINAQAAPAIKQRRFEKDYSIQIIPYTPSTPEHPEVRRFLTDLVTQVRQRQAALGRAVRQSSTPLEELAAEVRTWLQAIRYEVSDFQPRDDRTLEMLASLDQGTIKQRVRVRCIGGAITPADVATLDAVLDRRTPQGWLISDKRVLDRARAEAAQEDAIQVFNLSDFLRQKVWGPYIGTLTSLVEQSRIADLYVDLAGYKQEMDEEGREINRDDYPSVDAFIDGWLGERGKMHISLLGEFGTGKTWFCRHYASRQLARYLEDPARERLPLLITLRAFAKAMTAQQLINDALLEQYKLPFVGSAFEVFQEMNRRGKLLLILDGFDEMARQVDYQTVVDNFWELANLVDERSKVILTSRTEYFRWAKETEKILGGAEFGRSTIVLSPPKFEVLNLKPFSDDQIREVIGRRLGAEQGAAVAKRLLGTPNLAEMARKPVVVELLLAVLDEVRTDVLDHPAQVYLYATNKLLLRNIETRRTFTSTADKLYFLCELAWEMLRSNDLRVHYRAVPERISAYFGKRITDQRELDMWDFDLRNQTLLHRDAAGYYEFAHKSLGEYFVAFKFAAELGCLAPTFAEAYREADGQPCQLRMTQKDIPELAQTFGAVALTDDQRQAVCDLLLGVMSDDAVTRLWKVIGDTRGKAPSQIAYVGGNAATLLNRRGVSFRRANLAGTVLTGAGLRNADLTGADLQDAILCEAVLYGCTLENADLRRADLSNLSDSGIWSGFAISLWRRLLESMRRFLTVKVLWFKSINARGAQISGARGLEQETVWAPPWETLVKQRKGTLLEFFADCGAVLDEEQKRIVAEARQEENIIS
jgi:hypothetical protein